MSNNDIYGVEGNAAVPPESYASHTYAGPVPGAAGGYQQTYTGGAGAPPPGATYHHYYQAPQRSMGCLGFLGRFVLGIFLFFLFGFFILFFMGIMGASMVASLEQINMPETPLQERHVTGSRSSSNKIAIINVSGLIMEEEEGYIVKQIRQASADDQVKAIVLRVDSPGGTITGSDYYLHLLKKLKTDKDIPIVVSMGSMATSGGYYVSMAADEIFAEPTTITGSIGVIVMMYKGVELCKKIGIESTPITSGPLKVMGSFDKPLTDEQREIWQKLVDDNFDRFKSIIREGRPQFNESPEELDKLATGQIYMATEAQANGLVDQIGFVDDAIAAARERANLTENDFKAIRYRPLTGLAAILVEGRGNKQMPGMKAVTEMTTPTIYLLGPNVVPLPTE